MSRLLPAIGFLTVTQRAQNIAPGAEMIKLYIDQADPVIEIAVQTLYLLDECGWCNGEYFEIWAENGYVQYRLVEFDAERQVWRAEIVWPFVDRGDWWENPRLLPIDRET